jgi:hypothetical protein
MMAQNHAGQANWQKTRTVEDDCQIIRKVVKEAEAISEDGIYTWLIEHGYFMSDPEFEERLEYMVRDDVRMIQKADAGKDGKQEDRRGQLPQFYTLWFKKWDQGSKRNQDDDDDEF